VEEYVMKTALIPVDGTETALRAVHRFAALARGVPGVHAILMNVEPDLPLVDRIIGGSPDEVKRFEEPLRDRADQLLAPAKAELASAGVRVSTAVEFGDPAAAIVARAKDWKADLIVIGTERHGALASLRHGSVARKVLQQSDLPVLLVK